MAGASALSNPRTSFRPLFCCLNGVMIHWSDYGLWQ